ncbi:hypothetical protein C8Q76DRAFT_725323 [Earliella scabrosa]|nr:hypothetical protein C8Q76DRAFT_725323 [Earliella scabrosa]
MSANKSSLSRFSTVTLSGGHIPEPFILSRREAYPARQFNYLAAQYVQRSDWTPASLPQNGGHLHLELGERIGRGRSAVVYAAKVMPGADGDPPSSHPPLQELCVKIARPNRCRTLAREAWVYEQLAEGSFQGVMTPRCYGFFTANLSSNQPFSLWSTEDYKYVNASDGADDDPTRDDTLPDDKPLQAEHINDPPGARELSPWVDWRPNPDAPLLAVLVMSRAGSKYSLDEDDRDESHRKDLIAVLDDLTWSYIIHHDLRPANIVRAPQDTQKCPKHKVVHKWNLIDFAWSVVDDPLMKSPLRNKVLHETQRCAYRDSYFITSRRGRI